LRIEIFAALADDTRRRIVELLARDELAAGEVAAHFDCTRPAISHHLKVLRGAQLVRSRVDAQRRIYSVDPSGLEALDAWVTDQRRFWNDQLDRLQATVVRDRAEGNLPVVTSSQPKGLLA
jgi:DNA-binding transcriptional ArsR family regulator